MYRKRSGLNQRELGLLLGYGDQAQVSRHERSLTVPPLMAALGYEAIFHIPVSDLFPGIHERVGEEIEARLADMEKLLGQRSAKERGAKATAQKLIWLMERRSM